jgi:hypothetical protein
MNRWFLLLLTAIILIGSIIGLTGFPQRDIGPLDLLPRETIALIESKNPAHDWSLWRHGLVGKTLSRSDFLPFLANLNIDPVQVEKLYALIASIDRSTRGDGFDALFSRPSVVALLPDPLAGPLDSKSLHNRMVVVQRLERIALFPQVLTSFLGNITAMSSSIYQGQQLTHLQFEHGEQLTCFVHGTLLLWSYNQQIVERCANHLLQQLIPVQAGIQNNSPYARLEKMFDKPADTFAYARLGALTGVLPGFHEQKDGKGRIFPDHIAFATSTTPLGGNFAVSALAEGGQFTTFKKQYHLRDCVENSPLGEPSANTVLSFWTNWLKPEIVWGWFHKGNEATPQTVLEHWLGRLGMLGGVPLKSLLNLFGNEFELQIKHLGAPHQFPRAMAYMTIECRDQALVGTLLKSMLHDLQTVDVMVKGMKIVTVMLADGFLQPAYALVNGRLILADTVGLIEQWHQKRVLGPSMAAFQGQKFRSQRSNFSLLLRTGDMVEWLLPVITAVGKEYGGRQGEALGDWILFQPLVLSFIADLQAIETHRIRGYLYKDEALLEVQYSLAQ